MTIDFVFRNLDSSDALKEHIQKKAQKLDNIMPYPLSLHFALSVKKSEHHVEVKCHTKHRRLAASASTDDLYESIDNAIDRMETQLRKERDLHKGHKTAHTLVRPQGHRQGSDVATELPHKDKRVPAEEEVE